MCLLTSLAFQEAPVPEGFGQRAYDNVTTLHPLALLATIVLGIATVLLPRRWAAVPIVILACFFSPAQRLVIATLDFSLIRLLVLAGAARVLIRGEYAGFRINAIDRAIVVWSIVGMAVYTIRIGTVEAFIYQAGLTFDLFGMYFFLRLTTRDWADIIRMADAICLLAAASVVFFGIEYLTQRNLFAVFGGVNEFTAIREGKLRCQGPFPHPILAGTFWGVLLPHAILSWRRVPRRKILAALGIVSILGIVFFSGSSTPILTVGCVILGFRMMPFRGYMRAIRWTGVATLLLLHVVREKPVWHLISRIDILGGSTGYHRYRLIDAAIERWQEWFLLGTNSTAHWGYFLFDVTNQYVAEAVRGGIVTMILFVILLGVSFQYVGRTWRMQQNNKDCVRITWALGTSLFAECVMFVAVSISYSQQSLLVWLLVIAAIGSLAEMETKRQQLTLSMDSEARGTAA